MRSSTSLPVFTLSRQCRHWLACSARSCQTLPQGAKRCMTGAIGAGGTFMPSPHRAGTYWAFPLGPVAQMGSGCRNIKEETVQDGHTEATDQTGQTKNFTARVSILYKRHYYYRTSRLQRKKTVSSIFLREKILWRVYVTVRGPPCVHQHGSRPWMLFLVLTTQLLPAFRSTVVDAHKESPLRLSCEENFLFSSFSVFRGNDWPQAYLQK